MGNELVLVLLGGVIAAVPTIWIARMQLTSTNHRIDFEWEKAEEKDRRLELRRLRDVQISIVLEFVRFEEEQMGHLIRRNTHLSGSGLRAMSDRMPEHSTHSARARSALRALDVDDEVYEMVSGINRAFGSYFDSEDATNEEQTTLKARIAFAISRLSDEIYKLRVAEAGRSEVNNESNQKVR